MSRPWVPYSVARLVQLCQTGISAATPTSRPTKPGEGKQ
jgi:hypothetical protein